MERVKGIIGAVIGDIAGSSREFRGVPSMRFKLMDSRSMFTDDTVLTMAVAEWMKDRDNVNLEEALELARESALPSHDTPGAIAVHRPRPQPSTWPGRVHPRRISVRSWSQGSDSTCHRPTRRSARGRWTGWPAEGKPA